ncbi:RagB/SusD family nutrient uptake outer membrane protein [Limibacter armeniacum]|uniref:RagB/SusD family nutrient uptake outer membrane protein n=1 Tax=Limibacter armeniacum TaxID=466084 RepID=UPI002FE583B8
MKKLYTYIVSMMLGLTLLSSCDNYLEQVSPDQPTTDQTWVSYEAAEKYLASAYSYMQANGWRYHEYFYLPQNFRADDIQPENGTTAWNYLARIVGFNNTASDGVPAVMWDYWYKGLKLTNDVIANAPSMEMISQEERDELVAEAKFLRAWYHFNLLKNFHNVILVTNVAETPEELQLPAVSRAEVYQQIEEDLMFAAANLPLKWEQEYWGRATANAANAYLGKVLLYQGKWQASLDALNKVEGHDLVSASAFRGMFDGTSEVNEEVIFSRGYTSEQLDALSLYHQLGVAMAPGELNGGWYMASISEYFMGALEAGDIRTAATVLQNGETFDGEVINFNNPDFKMMIKYVESLDAITTNRSTVDLIFMRYADVMLMQAEAMYELGNDTEALAKVNSIRERANLAALTGVTGTALQDEIRKQRMIELVGEGQRYYDLVRWGIVKDQLNAAGQKYADNFEDKHEYFPIPLEEVQRNPNINPTPGF